MPFFSFFKECFGCSDNAGERQPLTNPVADDGSTANNSSTKGGATKPVAGGASSDSAGATTPQKPSSSNAQVVASPPVAVPKPAAAIDEFNTPGVSRSVLAARQLAAARARTPALGEVRPITPAPAP